MTGPLVAPELVAALPGPWQQANPSLRRKAIDGVPVTDPEQRAVALVALAECFAYMADVRARHGEEPDWGLPDEFWEYHSFPMEPGLRRVMPTLADITPENVRGWIEADVDPALAFNAQWTTPPDEVVGNVGQAWAFYIVNSLTETLIRWFRGPARDHLDPSERARLIGLFKAAVPRLPWRLAIVVVPGILDLGGPGEREYFDQLAGDQSLHEKTRAEAESVIGVIDNLNVRS